MRGRDRAASYSIHTTRNPGFNIKSVKHFSYISMKFYKFPLLFPHEKFSNVQEAEKMKSFSNISLLYFPLNSPRFTLGSLYFSGNIIKYDLLR